MFQGIAYGDLAPFISSINPKLTDQQVHDIQRSINRYAVEYHMEPGLIAAIIAVESKFKPNAVGRTHGEIGLMQLRPEFHLTRVSCLETRRKMLFSINNNIATGVEYLAAIRRVYEGHYRGLRWVEHYNRGINAKRPHSFPYTAVVETYYKLAKGEHEQVAFNERD